MYKFTKILEMSLPFPALKIILVVIKALKWAKWNKMEWSGKFHSIVWIFYDRTEHHSHSIVWIVDGMKWIIMKITSSRSKTWYYYWSNYITKDDYNSTTWEFSVSATSFIVKQRENR
jgi:hypothetical protein